MNKLQCKTCNKYKAKNKFYKRSNGKIRTGRCKSCKKNYYWLKRFKNNLKEKHKENVTRFRDKIKQKKYCTNCGEYKPFDQFREKDNCGRYGLYSWCKDCENEAHKDHYWNNVEKYAERRKEYYEENKDRELRLHKEWKEKNPQYWADWTKEKYHNDHTFRLKHNYRTRVNSALKYGFKSNKTLNLLGCDSWDMFYDHLEEQFEDGMTFDNYGEWHIDHEIPCSFWNFEDEKQQEVCFHYSNLQPLWANENRSKQDKIPNLFEGIKLDEEFLNNTMYRYYERRRV